MVGCATTEFKPFEVKVNAFEGRGGTKTVAAGMEIWDNDEPPRKYMVLGFIDDERSGGPIPMASLKSDIVQKAKEVGGDAVFNSAATRSWQASTHPDRRRPTPPVDRSTHTVRQQLFPYAEISASLL